MLYAGVGQRISPGPDVLSRAGDPSLVHVYPTVEAAVEAAQRDVTRPG